MGRRMRPQDCPYCARELPATFHEERGKRRGENVRKGLFKAKSEGKHIGRPITVDRGKILELRAKKLSMRKIAEAIGCSTHTVHNVVNGKS